MWIHMGFSYTYNQKLSFWFYSKLVKEIIIFLILEFICIYIWAYIACEINTELRIE